MYYVNTSVTLLLSSEFLMSMLKSILSDTKTHTHNKKSEIISLLETNDNQEPGRSVIRKD